MMIFITRHKLWKSHWYRRLMPFTSLPADKMAAPMWCHLYRWFRVQPPECRVRDHGDFWLYTTPLTMSRRYRRYFGAAAYFRLLSRRYCFDCHTLDIILLIYALIIAFAFIISHWRQGSGHRLSFFRKLRRRRASRCLGTRARRCKSDAHADILLISDWYVISPRRFVYW